MKKQTGLKQTETDPHRCEFSDWKHHPKEKRMLIRKCACGKEEYWIRPCER